MPELPEVEAYRRLAERALGRQIASVEAPDTWFVKRGLHPVDVAAALTGRELSGARRKGKLLMLDTGGSGPVLGLRFGMTGRLVLDGVAGVDDLLYASNDPRPEWERFGLTFADGTRMGVIDPRRLGGVELDPDEAALGPDALSVSAGGLRGALCGSRAPLKARLMDQARLAGVGNLIADEVLWRASLRPDRPAGSLSAPELRRLHRHLRGTLADLIERGGSHRGDFLAHRLAGGRCPLDGAELRRATVGGRTTWWCSHHQH